MHLSLPALLSLPILASASQWLLHTYTLTSNPSLTLSTLSYTIVTDYEAQSCTYNITGTATSPSTHAPYANVPCGNFTIGSSWSDQFGEGKGFTTLSIVKGNEIAYPAYEDSVLVDGIPVSPDRSFQVSTLGGVSAA